MSYLKKAIKKYFQSFYFFYGYLKFRIPVILTFSILVGTLDGFGLAMFIPLLQMVDGASTVDPEQLGRLSFLINGLGSAGIEINIYSILVLILVFFILKGVFRYVEGYFRVVYQQYFIRTIRVRNSDLLARFSFSKFIGVDSGRIQNTFSAEVGRVNYAFGTYFSCAQALIMVLVYLSLAFMTNAQFAVLISIGGALTNLIFKGLYKKTKKSSIEYTEQSHIFQGLLIQKVANFKYLKATSLIFNYVDKLKDSITKIEKVQKRMSLLDTAMVAVREPMIILVVVIVILVQIKFFSEELGSIILSLLLFYRALSSLMIMQKQWNSFLTVSGALDNMTSFIKELKDGGEVYGAKTFNQFKKSTDLVGVNFSYVEKPVLKNIHLSIEKNETIAFVGESGSGKTTLINLLAGLIKPSSGKLSIDGIDYDQMDIRTLQKRIGYITQEPVIFTDTIFNNVTFWDLPTKENKLRFLNALKKAAIYDFIDELPEKEQTPLGSNGINLSGGQRQRLSIARELYKEVDFLMMDEATSALDSETERSIQNHIDQLKGAYTILIIAHRLSTIKNADRIVLLKNGEIEGVGNFQQLINNSHEFKRMVALQDFALN
tara:strand:+ start:4064 stop:5869 length:1806 start_codon:yes stop_codon:yes gene_type:complete